MIESSLLIGVSISTGLLAIAHLALWSWQSDLHRVISYIIGCACLGVGIITTSYLIAETTPTIDPRLMVAVYTAHVGTGGAIIGGAWLIRWLYAQHRARQLRVAALITEAGEQQHGEER